MNADNAKHVLAIATAAILAVGGCGSNEQRGSAPPPAATQLGNGASSRSGPFRAILTASTHRPIVRTRWHWLIRVTSQDGEPLAATGKQLYLFAGKVVGRSGREKFVGVHHGTIRWPRRSVGFPLVFRVAVTTAKGRLELDYPVQVRE